MEIRHLKTFLTVARLLSFNKAAERLHYAQSSISAQIQALETELGVQLFDRLGRRILLTEAGNAYFSMPKGSLTWPRKRELKSAATAIPKDL